MRKSTFLIAAIGFAALAFAPSLSSFEALRLVPAAYAQANPATGAPATPQVAAPSAVIVAKEPTEPIAKTVWDYASAVLIVILTLGSGFIATYAVKLFSFATAKIGYNVTDEQKARLYALAVNAVNAGAAVLRAKSQPITKAGVFSQGLEYMKAHGGDIAKTLGVTVDSAEFETAAMARMEKAANDPSAPTPPEITPVNAGGAVKVATVTAA